MKARIAALALFALAASAHAQAPREQFKQMVEQLQKTPGDIGLRNKIVKLGAQITPPPTIPEEANRAFIRGNVFQKGAKDSSDYERAISAYLEALRFAPWWGDAYFNLAAAEESAGKFNNAIWALKLYMASVAAGSAEAREAQNKIYAVEAKKEMALNSPEAFLRDLDGGVWLCWEDEHWKVTIEIKGKQLFYIKDNKNGRDHFRFPAATLTGKKFTVPDARLCNASIPYSESNSCEGAGRISADGNTISYPILSAEGGTTCRRTR